MFEKIIEHIKDITGPRFYFLTTLIFLLAAGQIYQETVVQYIKIERYTSLEFRECRDILGLEKEMTNIITKNSVIDEYVVYLYQPKEDALYKNMITTNSIRVQQSVSLRGIYLAEQPTINTQFLTQPFYLADDVEIKLRPDLQYIEDLNMTCVLFYKLEVKGVIVGEINLSFHQRPSATELDQIIRDISPLLHLYIV